jgi:hypothetical protein
LFLTLSCFDPEELYVVAHGFGCLLLNPKYRPKLVKLSQNTSGDLFRRLMFGDYHLN